MTTSVRPKVTATPVSTATPSDSGGAQVAEEEEEREQHESQGEQQRVADVADDGLVLGDEEREASAEADAQVVAVKLRTVPLSDGTHPVHQGVGLGDAERGTRWTDVERHRRPVGMHQHAVAVAREILLYLRSRKRLLLVQPGLELLRDLERLPRGSLVLQAEGEGVGFAFLLGDGLGQRVSGFRQLGQREKQRPMVFVPDLGVADIPLDAPDDVRSEGEVVPHQLAGQGLRLGQPLLTVQGLHQHQDRTVAAHPA